MKINKIDCEQFAGINDKKIEFEDGLNVLVGPNESGKSTMVDLMYSLLFKNANLKRNNTDDKEFCRKYIPQKSNGLGDYLEGSLDFEVGDKKYILKKTWEIGDGSTRLKEDELSIKDPEEIKSKIEDALIYGRGLYDEIVFASQKRAQNILECLIKADTGTKEGKTVEELRNEIKSIVNNSLSDEGNESVDEIGQEIDRKIAEYNGNWDEEIEEPKDGKTKRGINNPWKKDVGIILDAYYKKENLLDAMNKAKDFEDDRDRLNEEITKQKDAIEKKQKSLNEAGNYKTIIKTRGLNEEKRDSLSDGIKKYEKVLEEWPSIKDKISKSKALKEKYEKLNNHGLYERIQEQEKETKQLKEDFEKFKENPNDYLNEARTINSKIGELESKIKGIDLTATIKKLGDKDINITSVITGESIDISDGKLDIKEPVNIAIEDIMEMTITAGDIDANEISVKIKQNKDKLQTIYDKFNVNDISGLEASCYEYNKLKNDKEQAEAKLDSMFDGESIEDVKKKEETFDVKESMDEIESQIVELADSKDINSYIVSLETRQGEYEKEYKSVDSLKQKLEADKKEYEKVESELAEGESIPEEFAKIEDFDEYKKDISESIDKYNEELGSFEDELKNLLTQTPEMSSEDYKEDFDEAELKFETTINEYKHWKHIKEVFDEVKENVDSNPMTDIVENFEKYLAKITGDKIKVENIDKHFEGEITSGNNKLNAEIVSEGTAETLSLALRLAMIEKFFPDGSGLIVLDDPFVNMDPDRTDAACELIKEFAKDNQVIFVTCDDKYEEKLGGNIINV